MVHRQLVKAWHGQLGFAANTKGYRPELAQGDHAGRALTDLLMTDPRDSCLLQHDRTSACGMAHLEGRSHSHGQCPTMRQVYDYFFDNDAANYNIFLQRLEQQRTEFAALAYEGAASQ
jgi:hypothetical protein